LKNDCPPFPRVQEHDIMLWDPETVDRPRTSWPNSDFGQDADEFVDWPYPPLASYSTVGELQLTSTFSPLDSFRPSDSNGKASECTTTVPHQALPRDDLSQNLDSPKTPSTSSSNNTAETGPIGDRGLARHRKRRPAHVPLDDTIICANVDPASEETAQKAHLQGCHNQIEKNYRNRLNKEFQLLFNALSECSNGKDLFSAGFVEGGRRSRSKGSILRLAKRRLLALQTENRFIASELNDVRRNWRTWQMGSCRAL
jgi:hypothetical protein